MRIRVASLQEMRSHIDQPLRINLRDHPREQLRRLDELDGHHPFRRLLRKTRRRMKHEPRLLRTDVDPILRLVLADLREEPGQQRAMKRILTALLPGGFDPNLARDLLELPMNL